MNARLLTFLVWVCFCVATMAICTPLVGIAIVVAASVLALAVRWTCTLFLQPRFHGDGRDALESVQPDKL